MSEEWWSLLQVAEAAGVPLRVWLQIPDRGIWLNESNVADFASFANDLLDFAQQRGISVPWLNFDLEPDLDLAEQIADSIEGAGNPAAALRILLQQRDPVSYSRATDALHSVVDSLHARGVKVMGVALPWIVDDQADGDADIQDLLNTPVSSIPWDQLSIIVYRPSLAALLHVELDPTVVSSYAASALRWFGKNTQIAVGTIGAPGILTGPGYSDPSEIAADIHAARCAGVESVSLYSLDGISADSDGERWLQAATQPSDGLCDNPFSNVPAIRGLIQAGDMLLGWVGE
jgi:hypothetical protein